MNLGNIKFQPQKRTYSTSCTLKINLVHLENVFKEPCKKFFKVNQIYFQRTLFSDKTHASVNKCIFSECNLYYFYILGSRPENGLRIAQMQLRQGSADFTRFSEP